MPPVGTLTGHEPDADGYGVPVFVFFSNRLGCLGSLLVSVVLTVVLILVLTR